LRVEYKGYLNQISQYKSLVHDFNESTIIFEPSVSGEHGDQPYVINNADITGFRKVSKFGALIIPLANLGVTIGSYFLFDSSPNFTDTEKILYSTALGIGSNYLLKLIFKDDIEFKIADGWKMKVNVSVQP